MSDEQETDSGRDNEVVQPQRVWSDDDSYSRQLGPPEIEDIPVYPSRLYYQHGGTRLREFAAERALKNDISHVWAEFGVEKGLSAYFFSHYLPKDGKFYLFDSFEGLPYDWQLNWWEMLPKGTFKWDPPPKFEDERLIVIPGLFEDVLPWDMGQLGFVHIDSDLYESAQTVLTRCNHQIGPGTVILFDELWGYHFWADGEYKALMEWGRNFKWLARDYECRAVIEIL